MTRLPSYIADDVTRMATEHGYRLVANQEAIGLLSFVRHGVRVNVYTTKMTVATCLDHPTKGKTQLFRRRVSMELLATIFDNPRVHTHKGYRKKRLYQKLK